MRNKKEIFKIESILQGKLGRVLPIEYFIVLMVCFSGVEVATLLVLEFPAQLQHKNLVRWHWGQV